MTAPSDSERRARQHALRPHSDEWLVRRAAQGDRRAFEAIYSRYQQDLYRFCLAMVGNPQDAQDALQNTMVKVLRALPGEEREIKLRPWLYRIARNESVETLRRRRGGGDEPEMEQAVAEGVAETAETRERLRVLLADLEQLPERQRAALIMRELSGLDFGQIGAAFGTSPAVARQTLYEARLSLRQLEEGREMRCADMMRELSDADGRVVRGRRIRAHLSSCPDCRAFRESIAERRRDLSALAPLPLAASAGLLQGILGAKATAAAGSGAAAGTTGGAGIAGTLGAGTGKAVATSAIAKSAATAIVVAAVGVSAADRGGVIDLPFPGQSRDPSSQSTRQLPPPAGSAGAGGAAAEGAGTSRSARDEGGPGNRGDRDRGQAKGGGGSGAQGAANVAPPRSRSAVDPPGGSSGQSAAKRRGRPDGLPPASEHGQQTAAAHKPAHAASPPGQAGAGSGKGKSSGEEGPPSAKPAPASKAKTPPAAPATPDTPAKPASKAKDGLPETASGKAPGLER